MYESFFGFREKPFNMTPDPRFLYLSKKHREALAQLIYGVKERKGFVVLSGEVGTGKTTVVRALLERLDESCQVAYIFNTKVSVKDFLRYVCHDFGLQVNGDSKIDYLIKLHDFLIESHNEGKTTTLIVDEAHNLDASLFEEIRMLTNLETAHEKLLQIFLVGQPELSELLEQSELWQLKQRISTRYHLLPLDRKETKEYIHTRMRIAGAKRLNCFTEGAIQKIYEYSQGIPRLINNICDNSLLAGYATDTPIINEKTIRECAADLKLEKIPNSYTTGRKTAKDSQGTHSLASISLVIILIGLLAAGIILFLWGKFSVPQSLSKSVETIRSVFPEGQKPDSAERGFDQTGTTIKQEDSIEPEASMATPLREDSASVSSPVETIPLKEPEDTIKVRRKSDSPQTPVDPESPGTRIAIAREGDTLSEIILREFGRVDTHLLEEVQRLNPELEDMNQIFEGQEIRLPEDPRRAYNNPGKTCYFCTHVASFKRFDEANKLFNHLVEIVKRPTIVPVNINGTAWYRVAMGEYNNLAEASLNAKKLVRRGRFTYAKPLEIPELNGASGRLDNKPEGKQ